MDEQLHHLAITNKDCLELHLVGLLNTQTYDARKYEHKITCRYFSYRPYKGDADYISYMLQKITQKQKANKRNMTFDMI